MINDYPDASGEDTLTCTPEDDVSAITATIDVGSVERSQTVLSPLSLGEALIQTASVITGGTAPGDLIRVSRPDLHHTIDAIDLIQTVEWIVGGSATGNDTFSINRPQSDEAVISRHRIFDGTTLLLESDTVAEPTIITPVPPDLTDSVFSLVV